MGARRFPKAACDRPKAIPTAATLITPVTAATGTEINPSGICIICLVFDVLLHTNSTIYFQHHINKKQKSSTFCNALLGDLIVLLAED